MSRPQQTVDAFLAQLQRWGVPLDAILRLRTAIDRELEIAGVDIAITWPETPRAITSRRMPAVSIPLEKDPDSEPDPSGGSSGSGGV